MDVGGSGAPQDLSAAPTRIGTWLAAPVMASPPVPTMFLDFGASLLPLLVVGLAFATLGWAWMEMFGRFREVSAEITDRPRFAVVTLVAASALTLTGLILLARALLPALSPQEGGHARQALGLLALAATGLLLTAVLTRLGRRFGWRAFLRERTAHRVETERHGALTDAMRTTLNPAIAALEEVVREMRHDTVLAAEVQRALQTIEGEVVRMKRLQELSVQQPSDGDRETTVNVEQTCSEVLQRLDVIDEPRANIRFFGDESLHLRMEPRHLLALLWGLLRAGVALADRDDPVVELLFRRDGTRLFIECTSNGTDSLDSLPQLEESRLVAEIYEGAILPPGPPYRQEIAVRLDAVLDGGPALGPATTRPVAVQAVGGI